MRKFIHFLFLNGSFNGSLMKAIEIAAE